MSYVNNLYTSLLALEAENVRLIFKVAKLDERMYELNKKMFPKYFFVRIFFKKYFSSFFEEIREIILFKNCNLKFYFLTS